MRAVRISAGIALLLLAVPLRSAAADISKYPCTVFSSDFCFRLPAGTHVDYSVPADFHLYNVAKGATSLATIYIGGAPARLRPSDGTSTERKSSFGTLQIQVKDAASGKKSLEAYLTPSGSDAPTMHIAAEFDDTTREAVLELLSSVRPCRAIKAGGQKCPINNVWGKELTGALQKWGKEKKNEKGVRDN